MNNARQVLDLAKRVYLLKITGVNKLLHFLVFWWQRGIFQGYARRMMS